MGFINDFASVLVNLTQTNKRMNGELSFFPTCAYRGSYYRVYYNNIMIFLPSLGNLDFAGVFGLLFLLLVGRSYKLVG